MEADRTQPIIVVPPKRWQAHVDVKTTDGYVVRMFAIAFTTRQSNQAFGPTKLSLPWPFGNMRGLSLSFSSRFAKA